MKRSSTVLLVFLMLSVLLFQGCLLDVTSVVIPSSTSTGKVITLTVNATATSDGTNHYGGLILQIPNGTSVLRVGYQGSASGIMIENTSITAGYIPESGYHLYGALAPSSHDGDNSVITFKVWLSVPNGVTPGTYAVKAAVGGKTESGMWVPQNPQATGSPVLHFSQISGKYASNAMAISTGTSDSVAPTNVTPVVSDTGSGGITVNIHAYDEAAQGDVAKYRVYLSKALFSVTAGRQLINNTTVPSMTGTNSNSVTFSADIGAGLSYFEIPPGSEYSLWINGLSWSAYYFAVTAVDLSGNESNPVVVRLAERGSITGSLTDGKNPISTMGASIYDSYCNSITSSGGTGSGNYTVVLPVGNYKVLFNGIFAGYVSEWHNNKSSCAAADIVTVTALNTTNLGVTTLAQAPACTYTISPEKKTFTSKGGTGSVTVTASLSSGSWTASEGLSWVSITSGSSGTSSGTVTYSVSANTSKSARTGNMTIAGKTFTITQIGKR